MNTDPKVRDLLIAIAGVAGMFAVLAWLLMVAQPAHATQPECTGDRHYDGVGCCPVVSSTTTTLPQECEECEPVLPCPEPPACPPVTCEATCEDGEDGRSAPPVIVQVDRCPEPEVLERCKVRRNGKVVCYRARVGKKPGPRSIWVPRSIMENVADKQRGY